VPHGAKGVGELPMDVGAPAVVAAIHDATGVWIHDLPATPERILAALTGGPMPPPPGVSMEASEPA
jgi:CO/xanthine dehydrogenase Mo-binding subunit